MKLLKRLVLWVMTESRLFYEDIKEGNIDTSEIEHVFWVFMAILFIFMIFFYASLDTSGAIYKL
jgi:hypothetical protein|tara:strand:+ start:52 stop:243 length:192 start_codon:yes stop_codon:yes gene_type:complete